MKDPAGADLGPRDDTAPTLHAAQQWLYDVVTHSESALAGVRQHRTTDVERTVRGNAAGSALDRLEIYQQSYFSRLEECLADDYPAVKVALGEAAFAELCRSYATAHPSRDPNLNQFGARFVQFAREHAPRDSAFVADLARLEWAIVEVLHAGAPERFSAAELERLPPDRLGEVRFVPSPAVRLLSFAYPVNDYFQAVLDGGECETPELGPSTVLVLRNGYRIRRIPVQQSQSTVLGRLISGEPLGAALTGVNVEEVAVSSWFREWTAWGVFATVSFGAGSG
jgi:hypothetical protein